jgi:hypothetical protein
MKKSPSKLWAFGPLIAVILLAIAYYINVPAFRDMVDARLPFIHELMAPLVRRPKVVVIHDPQPDAHRASFEVRQRITTPRPEPPMQDVPPQSKLPNPSNYANPSQADQESDLKNLFTNRSCWPKVVTLKRRVEFPAVANGKVIGKLTAPQGSIANLVLVKDGKLGVEYHGGGAWLDVKDTDALARVRSARGDNVEPSLNSQNSTPTP